MGFKIGHPRYGGRRKGQVCRRGTGLSDAAIQRLSPTQLQALIARLQGEVEARARHAKAALDARIATLMAAARSCYGQYAELEIERTEDSLRLIVGKIVVSEPSNRPCEVAVADVIDELPYARPGDRVRWTIGEQAFYSWFDTRTDVSAGEQANGSENIESAPAEGSRQ